MSRLPVKLNEMPLPVLLWMCPLFSPVVPFIEIVPDHLPFFLSAEILKLPGEIITPFCPAAADVVLPDVPEEESAEVLLALVALLQTEHRLLLLGLLLLQGLSIMMLLLSFFLLILAPDPYFFNIYRDT